jgi:hypothetical protein
MEKFLNNSAHKNVTYISYINEIIAINFFSAKSRKTLPLSIVQINIGPIELDKLEFASHFIVPFSPTYSMLYMYSQALFLKGSVQRDLKGLEKMLL